MNGRLSAFLKLHKPIRLISCTIPRWHHLCFTYNHTKNLISTFLDGELNNVQDFVLKSPVYGNWARLGQNFEARNSFSGDLTQVSRFEQSSVRTVTHQHTTVWLWNLK